MVRKRKQTGCFDGELIMNRKCQMGTENSLDGPSEPLNTQDVSAELNSILCRNRHPEKEVDVMKVF
jgi:hypothetical protein